MTPHLADMPIGKMRATDLLEWAIRLRDVDKYAATTFELQVSKMRSIFKQAERDGLILRSPAVALERFPTGRSEQDEIVPPTPQEVHTLVSAANTEWLRLAIRIGSECGLRAGEVAGLQVQDINRLSRMLMVQRQSGLRLGEYGPLKTRSSKSAVPLAKSLEEELVSFAGGRGPGEPLLVTTRANPLSSGRISTTMMVLQKKTSLRVRFHDLRHFYATPLNAHKIPVTTVSKLLGHANTAMTLKVYPHFVEDTLDDVRALLDEGFLRDKGNGKPPLRVI